MGAGATQRAAARMGAAGELRGCCTERAASVSIPGEAGRGGPCSLALACSSPLWAPRCGVLKPQESMSSVSLRLLQDKTQSATNRHSFHSKNTIKGCVLRSRAWEQFPPTLLQRESLGCCRALHGDARLKMQRGAEGGRGTAPWCGGSGEEFRRRG